jgi:DNA-binding CsgD family transcriptional regulator
VGDLKELYKEIDEAIADSRSFVKAHEDRIDETRASFINAQSPERRMMYADQMYLLYKSFDNDSALAYIKIYIDMADRTGQQWAADRGRSLMAYQYSSAGLYSESLEILKEMDGSRMQPDVLTEYLNARVHVYNELAYYTPLPDVRDEYYSRRDQYRDSLYRIADHKNPIYLQLRESELLDSHRFDEALEFNDNWMSQIRAESRDYAIVCYYRYLIYATMQEPVWSRYWLAQSALSDIRHAVMDQASLISLADLLNQDGDFERSYRYISFTWRSNDSFNTRMRSWQISPILTVIENDYQTQKERGERILLGMMISVSILAMLTLGALLFSIRERRKLAQARSDLQASNSQLTALNAKLMNQAQELTDLNERLSVLNSQLSEANWVKEEYIGHFLSLCSNYVDKMDNFRKLVNRKLKNREFEELAGITRSVEYKDRELEELYDNFDEVFLHLFPDFVQEFNALLKPEEQIQVKQAGRLTIDLRIFALIRLGIEDSSKIADFLHYSVNTIYSYRARIKNGAAGNRDEFENEVKKLGKLR